MRANLLVGVAVAFSLQFGVTPWAIGQAPSGGGKGSQAPPDEEKQILNEIKEAYKAPFEVHKDVLKELRKSYEQPSPKREAEIFKELRRLYLMTAAQEETILGEIRMAYNRPSADQEARIFDLIDRVERLPHGAVPPSVQIQQAQKMFQKLDLDGDGVLSANELPDSLRSERGRWDMNGNGFIEPAEYWAYYQGRLGWLSEQVASGQIEMRVGGQSVSATSTSPEEPRPTVFRAGKLPAGLPSWFAQLDTDGDAQLGLYEWKKSGKPLQEFLGMDRNGDGFVTVDELLRYLAQQPRNKSGGPTGSGTIVASKPAKR